MSGKATGWVLESGPKPTDIGADGVEIGLSHARGLRAILLAVADAANAQGEHAHPGRRTIIEHSLYSATQVDRALAELIHLGWLAVEAVGRGRGQATTYCLPRMKVPHNGEHPVEKVPTDTTEVPHSEPKVPHDPPSDQPVSNANGFSNVTPTPPNPPEEEGRPGDRMALAALLLAQREADDRGDRVNDRQAYVRARQRDILQEHESLWNLWLQDAPNSTPHDLCDAARPVAKPAVTPLDQTVAAQGRRLEDWTGRGQGYDRHPQYDPADDG